MAEFQAVATTSQFKDDEPLVIQNGFKEIAIFHIDGAYYAVRNFCPHRGGPIAEGERKGTSVTCPWHEWTFDLCTGECLINAAARLETFEVRVEGESILLAL